MALFNQYDSEYCTKATDVARKVQAVSSLGSGGETDVASSSVLRASSPTGHFVRLRLVPDVF